jgi:hypothetical protein
MKYIPLESSLKVKKEYLDTKITSSDSREIITLRFLDKSQYRKYYDRGLQYLFEIQTLDR